MNRPADSLEAIDQLLSELRAEEGGTANACIDKQKRLIDLLLADRNARYAPHWADPRDPPASLAPHTPADVEECPICSAPATVTEAGCIDPMLGDMRYNKYRYTPQPPAAVEPVGTVMRVAVDGLGESDAHIGWHRDVPAVGTKLYASPPPLATELVSWLSGLVYDIRDGDGWRPELLDELDNIVIQMEANLATPTPAAEGWIQGYRPSDVGLATARRVRAAVEAAMSDSTPAAVPDAVRVDEAMVERACAEFFRPRWPTAAKHNDSHLREQMRAAFEAALSAAPDVDNGALGVVARMERMAEKCTPVGWVTVGLWAKSLRHYLSANQQDWQP